MHLIIGTILLALFILAIRVIWHTVKTARFWFSQHGAFWQSQRLANPSVRPALPARFTAQNARPAADWEDLSQTIRASLLERNHSHAYRLEKLDVDLQVRLKTQAIMQADIEIAELQRRLAEAQALLNQPVKKRRKSDAALAAPVKKPNPAAGLRKALQGEKSTTGSIVH